jgi:hypothetical protein
MIAMQSKIFSYFELRLTDNVLFNGQIVEICRLRKTMHHGFAVTRHISSEELIEECDINALKPIPLSNELAKTMGLTYHPGKEFYQFGNM